MIMDERTEFADSLQPAAGIMGDVIDTFGGAAVLPQQARDLGAGHPLYWVVLLESAIGGGPGTVSLRTADNAALTTNPVDIATITIPATTAAGTKWAVTLPLGTVYKQFLGIFNAGTAMTGGAVSSFLALDVSAWRTYKDADN